MLKACFRPSLRSGSVAGLLGRLAPKIRYLGFCRTVASILSRARQ
jgi:hypothetical protein